MVYCNSLGKFGQIAVNMVAKDDVARLLAIAIKAKQQLIADDQLAAFVESNGRSIHDSISGMPVSWDAAHRTIGYGDQAKSPWFRVHI
jgi:hypothetical protein